MNAPITPPNAAIPFVRRKQAGDAVLSAAGMLIIANHRALFLKRAAGHDHAGEWCFPGGAIEDDETPIQTAIRETREETGWIPEGDPKEVHNQVFNSVDFTTFLLKINNPFIAELDDEHIAWAWAPLDEPPEPLHPGVESTLNDMADHAEDAAIKAAVARDQQKPANQASPAELRSVIKFPPPKAGGGASRVIDNSFARGGVGKELKFSAKAQRFENRGGVKESDKGPGPLGNDASTVEPNVVVTISANLEYPKVIEEMFDCLRDCCAGGSMTTVKIETGGGEQGLFGFDGDGSDRIIDIDSKQVVSIAKDNAEFKESDHPRGQPGNAGQFGSGGGKSSKVVESPEEKKKKRKEDWQSQGMEKRDHRPGVGFYAGSGNSYKLNMHLRTGKLGTPFIGNPKAHELSDFAKKRIDELTDTIEKEVLPEPMTVYRGVKNADAYKVGETIIDKGFFSTSTDRAVVERHATPAWYEEASAKPAILIVSVPKGARAATLTHNREDELLLQRGSSFKVEKIVEDDVPQIHLTLVKQEHPEPLLKSAKGGGVSDAVADIMAALKKKSGPI